MKNLKKLFLALMLFTVSIGYSQIETTISAPNTASVNDSILAITSAKKAKHIPFSTLRARVLADIEKITLDTLAFNSGGDLIWNTDEYTLNLTTTLGPTLQIGQEIYILIYNDTGLEIGNMTALRGVGATLVGSLTIPTVELAKSDIFSTVEGTLFFSTHIIPNGTVGLATRFGRLRDANTLSWSPGDALFVSSTVAGELTNVRPEFPFYDISVGGVLVSDASDGEIIVSVTRDIFDTFKNFYNGTFRENIDFTVSSSVGVITGSLVPENGHPDMTMIFSDGFEMLDTSPAKTIVLTAGTDTNPQQNFVYIPQSTKVLTLSTSSFPTTEHIKVATVVLQSASTTETHGGALKNRNWNDAIENTTTFQGHMSHIAERIRQDNAKWDSGALGTSTIDTGPTPDDVFVSNTSGMVYQLHNQSFPAMDTEVSDDVHVVNHFTTPYVSIQNLNTQTDDALGVALTNSSYSVVLWGVQNKTDEPSHLMVNLPTGKYAKNSPQNAVDDLLNYSVYTIPSLFKGVGFLIARFTYTLDSGGNIWTLYDTQDLRGKDPNTIAGGGGGGGSGITEFTGLFDTPSSYSGEGNKNVSVSAGETALEFTTPITTTSQLTNTGEDGTNLYLDELDVVSTATQETDVSAEWVSGLTFDVRADKFPLDGIYYTATQANVVLTTADGTFDRIDLIIANSGAPGTVDKITGTASANPAEPSYDSATQYPIKFVLVKASATTPDGYTNELIFDEDVGQPTEWDWTSSGAELVVTTNDPYNGTKSIEGTTTNFSISSFNKSTTVNTDDINTISFWIKLKADFGNSRINMHLVDNNSILRKFLIKNNQYGFDSSSLVYQKVVIDVANLNLPSTDFDEINIIPNKTSFTGYFIDVVNIQFATVVSYPPNTNTDEQVKVSQNDTNSGYLNGKLVAGDNISLVENNDGENETLIINVTQPLETVQPIYTNVDTLQLTQILNNKHILMTGLLDKVVTVPLEATESIEIGSKFDIVWRNTGNVNIIGEGQQIETNVDFACSGSPGGITGSGNLTCIITGALVVGTPLSIPVAVLAGDIAAEVGQKIRDELNATTAITDFYIVGGYETSNWTASVSLTAIDAAANDTTLNISLANGTCTGFTNALTSTNTRAGVAGQSILHASDEDLRIAKQNKAITLVKEDTDTWGIFGALNPTGDIPAGFIPDDFPITLEIGVDITETTAFWMHSYLSTNFPEVTTTKDWFFIWSSDHDTGGGVWWGQADDLAFTNFVESGQITLPGATHEETPWLISIPVAESGLPAGEVLFLYYHSFFGTPGVQQETNLVTSTGGLLHSATWNDQGQVLGVDGAETHTGYCRVIKMGVGDYVAHHFSKDRVEGEWSVSTSSDGLSWTRGRAVDGDTFPVGQISPFPFTYNGTEYIVGPSAVWPYYEFYDTWDSTGRPLTRVEINGVPIQSQYYGQQGNIDFQIVGDTLYHIGKHRFSNTDRDYDFILATFDLRELGL